MKNAMTFNEVANVLRGIAAIGSTTQKKAMLRQHDSDMLREVLTYALDPYRKYGVLDIKVKMPASESLHNPFGLLDRLADRSLTGNSAREEIYAALYGCGELCQELFINILNKDLRCGVGGKLAEAALPGFKLPKFECMLASAEGSYEFPISVEPKYDGVRTLAFVNVDGSVEYFSRNGRLFENFGEFDAELRKLGKGFVYDGEVIGTNFNELMTQARRKKEPKRGGKKFMVFDFLPISEFREQRCNLNYFERHRLLQSLFPKTVLNGQLVLCVPSVFTSNELILEEVYRSFVSQGYEGIILKKQDASYEFRRSKAWIKMKPTETIDVPVVGAVEGTGKYKGMLGALVVDVDGVEVQVGTGFSDDQRKSIWEAFQLAKKRGWKVPAGMSVAEIKYQEKTPDGSLRFPVFVQFRPDKED